MSEQQNAGDGIRARGKPTQEKPFAWQSKRALRKIGDSDVHHAHCFLVYTALSWIASDRKTEILQVSKGAIAKRIGLGARSVAEALYQLDRIGLVRIHREKNEAKKEWAINTYTILTCRKGNEQDAQPVMQTEHEGSCSGILDSPARNQNKCRKAYIKEKESASPTALPASGGGQPGEALTAQAITPINSQPGNDRPNEPAGLHEDW